MCIRYLHYIQHTNQSCFVIVYIAMCYTETTELNCSVIVPLWIQFYWECGSWFLNVSNKSNHDVYKTIVFICLLMWEHRSGAFGHALGHLNNYNNQVAKNKASFHISFFQQRRKVRVSQVRQKFWHFGWKWHSSGCKLESEVGCSILPQCTYGRGH